MVFSKRSSLGFFFGRDGVIWFVFLPYSGLMVLSLGWRAEYQGRAGKEWRLARVGGSGFGFGEEGKKVIWFRRNHDHTKHIIPIPLFVLFFVFGTCATPCLDFFHISLLIYTYLFLVSLP